MTGTEYSIVYLLRNQHWPKTASWFSKRQTPICAPPAQPKTVPVRASALAKTPDIGEETPPQRPCTPHRGALQAFSTCSGPSWTHWSFCAKDHDSSFAPDNGTHTRDWRVSCEELASKLLDLWGHVVSAATTQVCSAAPKQLEMTQPTGVAVFRDNSVYETGDWLSPVNSDISPSFYESVTNASLQNPTALLPTGWQRQRLGAEACLSPPGSTTHLGPLVSANFGVIACFSTSRVGKFQIIVPVKASLLSPALPRANRRRQGKEHEHLTASQSHTAHRTPPRSRLRPGSRRRTPRGSCSHSCVPTPLSTCATPRDAPGAKSPH